MRIIDADELREGWLEWDPYDTIEANTVLYSIDDQPTINPADLRLKGKWVASNLGYLCCSECHDAYVDPEWIAGGKWKYCPNCGARMEE